MASRDPPIPPGYSILKESTTSILMPDTPTTSKGRPSSQRKEVFLNPVQEYNRDLSVVALRIFSERFANEKAQRMLRKAERTAAKAGKKEKGKGKEAETHEEGGGDGKRRKVENGGGDAAGNLEGGAVEVGAVWLYMHLYIASVGIALPWIGSESITHISHYLCTWW